MKKQLFSWKNVKKRKANLAYKQGLLFKKSREPNKFREMHLKNGASKTRKSVKKLSKNQNGNEFKWF